jgi:hypothetical protein
MVRNYLKGRDGDRINGVVVAAGYNFSPLLRWLTALLRAVIAELFQTAAMPSWRAEGKVEDKIRIAIGGVKDTLTT